MLTINISSVFNPLDFRRTSWSITNYAFQGSNEFGKYDINAV